VFEKTGLKIFKQTLDKGGAILALQVTADVAKFSRKDFDTLIEYAKECGAGGLAYLKFTEEGADSPLAKFLKKEELEDLKKALPQVGKPGDVVFFAADQRAKAQFVLGAVRLRIAEHLNLIQKDSFNWAWVHEFPLFKYNEDAKRWDSEHHPFTSPHPDDIALLGKDNKKIRSSSYDLILNGNELASGSIRIHDADLQQKIFDTLGLDPEESKKRFGFLLDSFKYGPPPHGGIAVGMDRLAMIFLGKESIREVIAFPKNQKAICPLTSAPSVVDAQQCKDLGIKIA